MKRIIYISLLLCPILLFYSNKARAQASSYTHPQKQMMGGIIIGTDTFPVGYIPTIFIKGYLSSKERARLANLRYNVAKVYPYALTAAYVINKVDNRMLALDKRRKRKSYLRKTQKALKEQFKDELKNLTINQGKILVKLINRETGRNCYDVIKELRGGFNARIYQTMAYLFDNDLKVQYDPYGEDRDIEMIVQEIKAKNYFRYQSQLLEQRTSLHQKK